MHENIKRKLASYRGRPLRSILVHAVPAIGDVLLATPLIRSIRNAAPGIPIDVMVKGGCDGMLEGNPDVRKVLSFPLRPRSQDYWWLVRNILRRYDLSVSVSASDRAFANSILAAPRRVSLVPPPRLKDWWKHLGFHGKAEYREDSHAILQHLQLADVLGIERSYEVVLPYSEIATTKLDKLLPFAWQSEPYVALHMIPRYRYKEWPTESWKKLIRHFLKLGLQVVLTSGTASDEMEKVQAMQKDFPSGVHSLAGRLSFGEVRTLIENAELYLGTDTCITHLAAGTGTPTISLYGPTNIVRWSPWPKDYRETAPPFANGKSVQSQGNVLLLAADCVCKPINKKCLVTGTDESNCLATLSAEFVVGQCERFLNNLPSVRSVCSVVNFPS